MAILAIRFDHLAGACQCGDGLVSRSVVLSVLWFGLAGWCTYQLGRPVAVPVPSAKSTHEVHNLTPVLRCELAGTKVNRLIAEIQARGALSEGPFDRTPFEVYSVREVDEGFLVSLGPAQHAGLVMLGGGGLVWVDGVTGCVSILRLYQ